ncbi:hypothetical protein [Streptomyces niveus]|uniref:hypothetical protein n=1 Tax=Streptomyces niveus TaxID=193462 RepID=UPI003F4DE559
MQGLVEAHMETLLGVRLLASEYSTGPVHGGRIDSLGLDENGSPVIVEYKRGVDAGVINHGLFYLSWLTDHRAEFDHLVRDQFGSTAAVQVLWSGPRLICIADDFTRYDAHAVREHRRPIDLVRYRLFASDLIGLETVASATTARAIWRCSSARRETWSVRAGRGGGLSMMRGIAGLADRRSRAMSPRSAERVGSVYGRLRGRSCDAVVAAFLLRVN